MKEINTEVHFLRFKLHLVHWPLKTLTKVFFLSLISLFLVSCDETKIPAKVLQVTDGDTLRVSLCEKVLNGECVPCSPREAAMRLGLKSSSNHKNGISTVIKLRMLGMDAPETKQQDWGKKATEFLKQELSDDKYIFIETDIEPRDRYGRLLAYVYDSQGISINEKMLREGYAELLILGANDKYATSFKAAEAYARQHKLNIWSEDDGLEMSPYKYRKKMKGKFKSGGQK
jgi:endonuclease YncB( thermonuclease family)